MHDSPLVDIGDGVRVPSEIHATAQDVDGYTVDVTATYQVKTGRYEIDALTVHGTGRPITGESLRGIPVAEVLRLAVISAINVAASMTAEGMPVGPVDAGPTDEMLRWVARVYRVALLMGDPPTQSVASGFKIPRSTAGRWVTRARDRGFLSVQDPRGARTRA